MAQRVFNTSKKYTYTIQRGALESVGSSLTASLPNAQSAFIVSDKRVGALYLDTVVRSLKNKGIRTFTYFLPEGEEGKTADNLVSLLNGLAEASLTRSDAVLALGGGSVSDTAALSACLFKRGVGLITLPTTLLSAVDAAVGGKNAVDFCGEKNLIGTFYQPDNVICDPDCLLSLSTSEFQNGIAEIIKYGAVFDGALFDEICVGKTTAENISDELILKCVSLKQDVVSRDEFDVGERRLLNFGHTIGHAAEALSGYKISHGQAVSMGMYLMARCCDRLGLSVGTAERLACALNAYHLPTHCPFSAQELFNATVSDKKCCGNNISLVTLKKIGSANITPVSRDSLLDFIRAGI